MWRVQRAIWTGPWGVLSNWTFLKLGMGQSMGQQGSKPKSNFDWLWLWPFSSFPFFSFNPCGISLFFSSGSSCLSTDQPMVREGETRWWWPVKMRRRERRRAAAARRVDGGEAGGGLGSRSTPGAGTRQGPWFGELSGRKDAGYGDGGQRRQKQQEDAGDVNSLTAVRRANCSSEHGQGLTGLESTGTPVWSFHSCKREEEDDYVIVIVKLQEQSMNWNWAENWACSHGEICRYGGSSKGGDGIELGAAVIES